MTTIIYAKSLSEFVDLKIEQRILGEHVNAKIVLQDKKEE